VGPRTVLDTVEYSLQRERVCGAVAQKRSLFTEPPLSNGSIHHSITATGETGSSGNTHSWS
jgi:hypothetical protein